ncbi:MAG: HAD family hydrolase [Thermodesulfobacteriota bacterium]
MSYDALFDQYISPLFPIPTGLTPAGQLSAPVHAIFFDIYGTLFVSQSVDIDSMVLSGENRQELGRLLSRHEITMSVSDMIGWFADTVAAEHRRQNAFGVDYPEVQIERIWMTVLGIDDIDVARRFALAFELIVNPVYAMPHLEKLLLACNRSGLELGIISNAQFYTPFLFERFCGHFPEALGFDEDLLFYSHITGQAKPSPVMFQKAVRRLYRRGILPRSVLYVGNDMLNDIWAAKQAGFQTALFAGDKRSLRLREDDPRCRHLPPDLVITELDQLIEHLQTAVH